MELCFDETELFQVILDKQVQVLDCKLSNNADCESLYQVIDKDTKVMSMHLRSSRAIGGRVAGDRLAMLGPARGMPRERARPAYNTDAVQPRDRPVARVPRRSARPHQAALEESLRKSNQCRWLRRSSEGSPGRLAVKGSTDLRTLMNQIEALAMQLETYRPNIARSLLSLASVAGG